MESYRSEKTQVGSTTGLRSVQGHKMQARLGEGNKQQARRAETIKGAGADSNRILTATAASHMSVNHARINFNSSRWGGRGEVDSI